MSSVTEQKEEVRKAVDSTPEGFKEMKLLLIALQTSPTSHWGYLSCASSPLASGHSHHSTCLIHKCSDPVASSLCAPDSSGKSRTWLMTGEHTQTAEPNLPAREKPQTWASVPPLAKQEEDSQYMARCTANQEKTHKPKGSATRGSKKCGWGAVRGSQKASESLAGLMEDTSLLTQLIQTGEGEYYFRWEDCNADFKGHEKSRKHDTTKGWQCWQNFS